MLVESLKKFLQELQTELSQAAKQAIEDGTKASAPYIKEIVYKELIIPSVDEYYEEYSPTIYKKRMYDLYNIFEVDIESNKSTIIIEGRVVDSQLSQHYSRSPRHKSGSEWISRFDSPEIFDPIGEENGMPESSWIVDNFWEGIHPKMGIRNGDFYDESEKFSPFMEKIISRCDIAEKTIANVIFANIIKEFDKHF